MIADWTCLRCTKAAHRCRCQSVWMPGDPLPPTWEDFLAAIPDPDAPCWDQQFPLHGPPARVAVAVGEGDQAIILFRVGAQIDSELDNSWHLDDLGLELPPARGVSIWEGSITWSPGGGEYYYDGDIDWDGRWRRPTAREWAFISRGLNPWTEDAPLIARDRSEGHDLAHANVPSGPATGHFLIPTHLPKKQG